MILKNRKWLADVLETDLAGRVVAGDLFEKAVELCRRTLPARLHEPTLRESLRCLAGRTPTRADLDLLAYRLVGNLDRLRMRRPVTPWVTQSVDEKALVQIAVYRPELRKTPTTRFTVQIITGLAAGLRTQVWWDNERCAIVAAISGFDRLPRQLMGAAIPPHLYEAPAQLVGIYGEVLVDGAESAKAGTPLFKRFNCPDNLKKVNRELLRKRFRSTPKHPCPKNYPANFPCHYCPVGYLECPAAVHEQNYSTGLCPACKDPEAVFDPDWSTDRCVNCIIKDASKP